MWTIWNNPDGLAILLPAADSPPCCAAPGQKPRWSPAGLTWRPGSWVLKMGHFGDGHGAFYPAGWFLLEKAYYKAMIWVYPYFGTPPNGVCLTERTVKTNKAEAVLRKNIHNFSSKDVPQVFLPVWEFRHQTENIGSSTTK